MPQSTAHMPTPPIHGSSDQWCTADELSYLSNIGEFTENQPVGAPAMIAHKIKMLKRYLAVSQHKADWGAIKPDVAMEHARALLVKLQELQVSP